MNEQEFWAALAPVKVKPIVFKLYYDENGKPLIYTTDELPGNYIEIDGPTYHANSVDVRVIDGKLTVIVRKVFTKLAPNNLGTCCDPRDVSIVVPESQPHIKWSLQSNEKYT
jgi:hypothetical protein